MPIRPELRALYPANWPEIRMAIRARANDCCERCGRPNHVEVLVGWDGQWTIPARGVVYDDWRDAQGNPCPPFEGLAHYAKTVLTVAHLDHDPTNNDPRNLQALCQRCHLKHDGRQHAANARRTRAARRGQGSSLPGVDQ